MHTGWAWGMYHVIHFACVASPHMAVHCAQIDRGSAGNGHQAPPWAQTRGRLLMWVWAPLGHRTHVVAHVHAQRQPHHKGGHIRYGALFVVRGAKQGMYFFSPKAPLKKSPSWVAWGAHANSLPGRPPAKPEHPARPNSH